MYLGIDLGTSNSAIAGNSGSDLKLFKTAEGNDVLPSVIYIDKRGHKFIGMRAYDKAILSPENVAQGFKRLMGTSSPIRFAAAALEMSPEQCSEDIIRTLLGQAKTEAGDFDVVGAVVTIPAAFNQMQSEVTIKAAGATGLGRVGLLQEPIAAAMASMAGSKSKNGQFLVYDLGGGTFDAALVQSVGGSVNIVAHEGINMLGGRDFDRMLVNEFARPWLMENFSLPQNFQTDDRYQRLVAIARHAAEKAKIELSSADTAVIYAGDEEIRVADENGNDIYLSIDITRKDLEGLIVERLDETILLCHKILKDNGYNHEDIDRIVFIGGPSKMPCVRTRVPKELGVPAPDFQTDPMTAVAIGAAIFAESREWSKGATKRKSSRTSATVKGPIDICYDFSARISNDQARIRVKPSTVVETSGYRLRIDTPEGWSSGLIDITSNLRVEVPVANIGDNRFRITVYDPSGAPVAEACSEITIVRTHASAAGIPATHTLSVKVVETESGTERNELEKLVLKGTLLPAHGKKSFRAAKALCGGQKEHIDIEFFEQAEGVPEPELNLSVGSFQLEGTDFEEGYILRKGDEIIIHWKMNDNGLLKCSAEIPSLGSILDTRNFYTHAAGHQNFEGNAGEALAGAILADAERDLEALRTTLGNKVDADVERLQLRAERQKEALSQSVDADTRRSVAEEARAIRQEVSRLKHAPENRKDVLLRELAETQEAFDRDVRDHTDTTSADLFDRLLVTVRQAIRNGDTPGAERALHEMKGILYRELLRNPAYLVALFKTLSSERYLSGDKELHDKLVSEGLRALDANDIDGLRHVIVRMFDNHFSASSDHKVIAARASLMRG